MSECRRDFAAGLPELNEIVGSRLRISEESVKCRDIDTDCVHALFVRFDKRCPTATKRIQHDVARLKTCLLLKCVGVRIQKIRHQLRDEFPFVGMQSVDMLRGFCLLYRFKGQGPVQFFAKFRLPACFSWFEGGVVVTDEALLGNQRHAVLHHSFDLAVLDEIVDVCGCDVFLQVLRCPFACLFQCEKHFRFLLFQMR